MKDDRTAGDFSPMNIDASDRIWMASNTDDLGGADDFGEGCGDCADPDGAGVRYLAAERTERADGSVQDLLAVRHEVVLGK